MADPAGHYPIALLLRGRRAVVVGAGRVATRRTLGLLAAGARVTVVSPVFPRSFARAVDGRSVTCVRRRYEPGDLKATAI
ncbi:MAG: NAD(P)-dependent oxidoreductase, partial [Candidatus Rokubacteria bacterium]|nr:NAD(P)-dependent oxidoreductase [Candidatus Rokubacteria bacterium]